MKTIHLYYLLNLLEKKMKTINKYHFLFFSVEKKGNWSAHRLIQSCTTLVNQVERCPSSPPQATQWSLLSPSVTYNLSIIPAVCLHGFLFLGRQMTTWSYRYFGLLRFSDFMCSFEPTIICIEAKLACVCLQINDSCFKVKFVIAGQIFFCFSFFH